MQPTYNAIIFAGASAGITKIIEPHKKKLVIIN